MKIGFTGTRLGMSPEQYNTVYDLLLLPVIEDLHHGDCIGSDAEAHEIAKKLGYRIIIHPPTKDIHRAFCRYADEMRDTRSYFTRNEDIVKETEMLIATPRTNYEEDRGGTWNAVNFARKLKKRVVIVWRDGTMKVEG